MNGQEEITIKVILAFPETNILYTNALILANIAVFYDHLHKVVEKVVIDQQ